MRSLLKSSTGLLLAALLLAWTSLCGAGMISHCSIGDHDSCDHGIVHFTAAGVPDSPPEAADHHHPEQSGCSCPLDHEHSAPGTEMLPLHPMAVSPPILAEIFACPVPPSCVLTSLGSQPPEIPPGGAFPGPPPPHLACGPLLI